MLPLVDVVADRPEDVFGPDTVTLQLEEEHGISHPLRLHRS